jgi:hypothetical protein
MPLTDVKELQAALRTAESERNMFLRGLVDLWRGVDLWDRIGDENDMLEAMREVREVLVKFVETPTGNPQEKVPTQTADPDQYFR